MRLGRMKDEATPQVSALPSTLYHFSPLCSTFTQILLHFWDKSKHFFDTFSRQCLIFRVLRLFPIPYIATSAKKHHISYKIWCFKFFQNILWKFLPFFPLKPLLPFSHTLPETFYVSPGSHPVPDGKKWQSGFGTAHLRYFRLLLQGSVLPARRIQCMVRG